MLGVNPRPGRPEGQHSVNRESPDKAALSGPRLSRLPKKPFRSRRRLAALVVGLLLTAAGAAAASYNRPPATPTAAGPSAASGYNVIRFDDGDTFVVNMDGNRETIRLIGVDTPETRDPRKPVQCFGKAASDFSRQLIGQQALRLESDPLSSNRDRYNRLLRYAYLPDGRLVNAEIISQGYGFAYTAFPFTKSDQFLELQRRAREAGKGLWSGCRPQPNRYGGYTSNPAQ